MKSRENEINETLKNVFDPEIPMLSVIDLGMITAVKWDDKTITVSMIPTYAACPASGYIKKLILDALNASFPASTNDVLIDTTIHWDTNRISEFGKQRLKEARITPPPFVTAEVTREMLLGIACPVCNGTQTFLQMPFGYTLCRAIHFCKTCNQSFEQFKPLKIDS